MSEPIPFPQPPADVLHFPLARTLQVEISRAELLTGLSDDDIRAECARRGLDEVLSLAVLAPEQIRGARGLLDWTLADLAAKSRVSISTIKRIEDGSEGHSRPGSHAAIRRAIEAAGVQFVNLGGSPGMVRAAPAPQMQAAE